MAGMVAAIPAPPAPALAPAAALSRGSGKAFLQGSGRAFARLAPAPPRVGRRSLRGGLGVPRAQLQMYSVDDFRLDRDLGKVGYMTVLGPDDPDADSGGEGMMDLTQEVVAGGVEAKMYTGRIQRGDRMGTRCIMKAYPPRAVENGATADLMAANEFATHANLQPPSVPELSEYVQKLLGAFVTPGGENWLVYRDDGVVTAAAYAAAAAEAGAVGKPIGERDFTVDPITRRRQFVTSVLRRALLGLEFMHSNGALHCSLGPSVVFLSSTEERDPRAAKVKLGGLAFSVDVSEGALEGGGEGGARGALAEDLWRRAAKEGASSPGARRAFGVAEDVYQAGLLVATLCFLPFCEPGSISEAELHQLLERTCALDIDAARQQVAGDPRWKGALDFLDASGGAGWDLLAIMLHPNYTVRPDVRTVLQHPFMLGAGYR